MGAIVFTKVYEKRRRGGWRRCQTAAVRNVENFWKSREREAGAERGTEAERKRKREWAPGRRET